MKRVNNQPATPARPRLLFLLLIILLHSGAVQYPYHREKIIGTIKSKQLVEDCLRTTLDCPGLRIDGIVAAQNEEEKQVREEDTVNTLLRAFGGRVMEEGGTV